MHQQRENLDILFRRTMPEAVLREIRTGNVLLKEKDILSVGFDDYTYNAYDRYSLLNLPEYSLTETEMRREEMMNHVEGRTEGVFYLLYQYADSVLHYDGKNLTCKLEEVLNWHSIYLRLGQDIFTTAWFAKVNASARVDRMKREKLTWPAILKTDDARLNNLFKRGLAENHCHLQGSTQNFPLSWACLMNHPMKIHAFLNDKPQFRTNLNYNPSSGSDDNVCDWETRILYAAALRALLFECCLGMYDDHGDGAGETLRGEFNKLDLFLLPSEIRQHTEMLRHLYGARFKQTDGREVCLDYACCGRFYLIDADDHNRLLAGERSLLYQCFRRQFRKEASRLESNLLYLYLLIKSNFRGELVQINNRYGFRNFQVYQDRKNQLFEKEREYAAESYRLSISSGMKENHLVSMEARIGPGYSAADMHSYISSIDKQVRFSQKGCANAEDVKDGEKEEKDSNLPFFYVAHFIKCPFDQKEFKDKELARQPRNYQRRRLIKCQARALERYMRIFDRQTHRLRGIDAASMEIGCRPETFATEIRYLRACSRNRPELPWYCTEEAPYSELGVTYHVGEDFLDIADGLRATDEALRFLDMERGDRIGHGLVLGVDPDEYYRNKKYSIYLRRQDYLDNLVWLLYRSLELGVTIKDSDRVRMTELARELLNDIFPGTVNNGKQEDPLYLYYHSWQLRGDHPDLYLTGGFDKSDCLSEYDEWKIVRGLTKDNGRRDTLKAFRENQDIVDYYCGYQFDYETKKRGYPVVGVWVEKWYIDLMREMQQAMQKEIFKRGVCIECNPTSNVLIGTFKTYIKHPILRFNDYHLEENSGHMNLRVSINTDDLGVFDTSLENEYALMFEAVCRSRHEAGNYNDDAVYDYMEYLRTSGICMTFGSREEKI